MLSKSFKAAKCKTALKLALARIKLLKNKKEVQLKQMKKDLAKLLEVGQDHAARIQVESVFREEKTKAAYEFVEVYCESVTRGLPIIESQKSCPIQLKEAVSSVIFASARCADIPELQDVCKQFVAKYGKEFVTSALELRPDSGVNHLIIEKLSSKNPDAETKIKILRMVAQECNVKWDPASYREQVLKPPVVDLLNERPNFLNASTLHMESPDVHSKPPPSQKSEPATKSFNGDVLQLSPSSQMSASSNSSTPASMPMASLATGRKAGVERIRHSFLKDGTISVRRNDWSMEFKDATSAAQVAAECAEMASVAARTAAELSSRGYFACQSSTESSESCFHGPSNEGCRGSNSSKLIADSIEDVSPRSSAWLKSKTESPQSNRMEQDQQSGSADSRDSRHGSIRRSNMSVHSHSTITSIDEDTLVGFSQGKSSESSERIIKTRVSSQSDDPFPIRYDESKGLTSESEGENFNFRRRSAYHSLSHKPNVSARSLSSARMGDGLAETAVSGKVKVEVVRRNTGSYDFSNEELNVLGNSWKRYGTGYPPTNQRFSGHVESPRQSDDFNVESSFISISEERDLHSSRTPSAKDAESNNSLTPQSPATTRSSEISDCPIDENRSILNFGRFTGGLRNKAFSQQPYTRVHSADFSSSSKHEFVNKTSSKSEKNTIFTQEKSSMSHVVHNYKPYNQAPSIRVDEELSANLKTPFNFDTEIADKVRPCQNVRSNGPRGGTLSGRSSDFPSQSNMGITSEVSNTSVCGDRSRLPQEISYSSAAPLSKPLFQAANDRSRVNSLSLHPDSLVEQPSNSHRQIGSSAAKEGGKLTQSNSAVENRPKTIQKANTLGSSVEGLNALGASGWSTSRENSIKLPSHVHPKLPDYDTLAAHFKALRSNRLSL